MQRSKLKPWRLARRAGALFLLLGLLLRPALLRAKDTTPLEWNPAHARFRTSEVLFTGALTLQVASVVLFYPQPGANWHGGILFDDAVRDAVLLEDASARATAAQWSDRLYYGLLAYPFVDTTIAALGEHGSPDVATEMLAMNLEAYAFSGALALSAEKLGRVRPAERGCAGDAEYSPKCGNDVALNASFASGHTALAFTSAGLTCAHHQHLPLYGGGAPDLAACLVALSAASATGALRVMSDNHYTSDVLIGMGIGLFGGYGLPTLLHYGSGSGGRAGGDSFDSFLPVIRVGKGAQAIAGVLAPRVGPDSAEMMWVGAF
jgi:membrane-associated phospholipid phosphatase